MTIQKTALRCTLWFAVLVVLLVSAAFSQSSDELDKILASMDQTSQKFHNVQASFTAKTWNSVVNSFDSQPDAGKIYLRKTGAATEASAVYSYPPGKQVLFSGDKLTIYDPSNGVKTYDASAHRDELETFLGLGLGSSGAELRKSFDIKDLGAENLDNVRTEKLELVPKSASVQAHVPRIFLWIDPQAGMSRQQEIYMEKDGDYRLAQYSDIRLNQKISGNVFKLKASDSSKTVSH